MVQFLDKNAEGDEKFPCGTIPPVKHTSHTWFT